MTNKFGVQNRKEGKHVIALMRDLISVFLSHHGYSHRIPIECELWVKNQK